MCIDQDLLNIAENIDQLNVANLAFRYVQLEYSYRQISAQWTQDSLDYRIVESLFQLALFARKERVHPIYASMPIVEWTRMPSHAQTLCWLNQLHSCMRKKAL